MDKKLKERQFYLDLSKKFKSTILITELLWILIALIIFFVDPTVIGIKIIFLILIFLAFFYTLTLILANRKRALIISSLIIILLILASMRLANFLNIALLIGFYIVLETKS